MSTFNLTSIPEGLFPSEVYEQIRKLNEENSRLRSALAEVEENLFYNQANALTVQAEAFHNANIKTRGLESQLQFKEQELGRIKSELAVSRKKQSQLESERSTITTPSHSNIPVSIPISSQTDTPSNISQVETNGANHSNVSVTGSFPTSTNPKSVADTARSRTIPAIESAGSSGAKAPTSDIRKIYDNDGTARGLKFIPASRGPDEISANSPGDRLSGIEIGIKTSGESAVNSGSVIQMLPSNHNHHHLSSAPSPRLAAANTDSRNHSVIMQALMQGMSPVFHNIVIACISLLTPMESSTTATTRHNLSGLEGGESSGQDAKIPVEHRLFMTPSRSQMTTLGHGQVDSMNREKGIDTFSSTLYSHSSQRRQTIRMNTTVKERSDSFAESVTGRQRHPVSSSMLGNTPDSIAASRTSHVFNSGFNSKPCLSIPLV